MVELVPGFVLFCVFVTDLITLFHVFTVTDKCWNPGEVRFTQHAHKVRRLSICAHW